MCLTVEGGTSGTGAGRVADEKAGVGGVMSDWDVYGGVGGAVEGQWRGRGYKHGQQKEKEKRQIGSERWDREEAPLKKKYK